jgi:membrane glycosyltransferase
MRGLRPISRVQLMLAIVMYLGAPGWLSFVAMSLWRSFVAAPDFVLFRADLGISLFAIMMTFTLAPKLATILDVATRRSDRRAYGGGIRFALGFAAETLFTTLLAPIMAVAEATFLIALLLGRTVGWTAQQRDDHAVPFGFAARKLWPQTLAGFGLMLYFTTVLPGAFWISLPFWGPMLGAIPFAMLSAHAGLGRALGHIGLCRIPEETYVPPAMAALRLPALERVAPARRPVMAPEGAGAEG